MQLFLDMDGVLADFDRGYFEAFGTWPDKEGHGQARGEPTASVDWDLVRGRAHFYRDLPPMADFRELVVGVYALGFVPIVLTGVPAGVPEATANKREWVERWMPGVQMVGCRSRDKSLHMKQRGDILVDDWERYQANWVRRGGVWVTHRSAAETLERLRGYAPSDR